MMDGADILISPPARRARRGPADPCEMAENREKPENAENRENAETAENGEPLKRTPTASAPETLKHETAPASCGKAETVKHTSGRASWISPRTARETVKQPLKIQADEGLTCFTPHAPAPPPETPPHRWSTRRETLKHPPAASSDWAKP